MTGDWEAVAEVVNARMTELELSQRDVERRADLTKATLREIRQNIKPRNRKPRTLEALSKALDWHPDHLSAVLQGQKPPEVGKSFARGPDDIAGRLDVISDQLAQINERLAKVDTIDDRFAGLKEEIASDFQRVVLQLQNPGT